MTLHPFKVNSEKGAILPLFLILVLCLNACVFSKKGIQPIQIAQDGFVMELPLGFDSIPVPSDNQFSAARVELGKRLFFDRSLSRDSSLSCSTCHQPELLFTDGLSRSIGIDNAVVDRNAPSLLNIAYHPHLLREGGVPTLEMQVAVPVEEHREFGFNMVLLADRLRMDSAYAQMARTAYGRDIDPYVITRALACYERTLISGNSPFDRFSLQGDKTALNPNEIKGYELFVSDRLNCIECHSGFDLTNYKIECNGLYSKYEDIGLARMTYLESDNGKFKVPSLRNVARTAPYMHDGSFSNLSEVIDHYAEGGRPHPNKSELITGFDLSELEKSQLLAFLNALSDDTNWAYE